MEIIILEIRVKLHSSSCDGLCLGWKFLCKYLSQKFESSDSTQHAMNSVFDKNFYENIYLRNSSQVIQSSMGLTLSLIKIFMKIFILEICVN